MGRSFQGRRMESLHAASNVKKKKGSEQKPFTCTISKVLVRHDTASTLHIIHRAVGKVISDRQKGGKGLT